MEKVYIDWPRAPEGTTHADTRWPNYWCNGVPSSSFLWLKLSDCQLFEWHGDRHWVNTNIYVHGALSHSYTPNPAINNKKVSTVFKTTKDIQQYLLEKEGNKVIMVIDDVDSDSDVIVGYNENGELWDYSFNYPALTKLQKPEFWKPYEEKDSLEWFGLESAKGLLCYFWDNENHITIGKFNNIASDEDGTAWFMTELGVEWRYAKPVPSKTIHDMWVYTLAFEEQSKRNMQS